MDTVEVRRIKPDGSTYAVAAGAANIVSDQVDTAGYEGVEFIVGFGTIVTNAVTSIKLQQSAVAGSGQADLLGTSQAVSDASDDKIFRTGIYRPEKRYVNVAILRATQNSTIDFVLALLYGKQGKIPITHGATVGGTPEKFASPIEGTA